LPLERAPWVPVVSGVRRGRLKAGAQGRPRGEGRPQAEQAQPTALREAVAETELEVPLDLRHAEDLVDPGAEDGVAREGRGVEVLADVAAIDLPRAVH